MKIKIANVDPFANKITLIGEAARAQREGELISERTYKAFSDLKQAGMKLGNCNNLLEAQKLSAEANCCRAVLRDADHEEWIRATKDADGLRVRRSPAQ